MGKAKKFFMYLILTVASILSVFPLYYMFCASTNRSIDVIAGKLIPGTYLMDNFKSLIAQQNLRLALWNSFRNATVLTVLCLLVCIRHSSRSSICWTILSISMRATRTSWLQKARIRRCISPHTAAVSSYMTRKPTFCSSSPCRTKIHSSIPTFCSTYS